MAKRIFLVVLALIISVLPALGYAQTEGDNLIVLSEGEEYIMDVSSENFTKSSRWQETNLWMPERVGTSQCFLGRGVGLEAKWMPHFAAVEDVEIFYYTPAKQTNNETNNLEIEIFAEGKKISKFVDCTNEKEKWHSLGKYNFSGKGDEYVKVYSVAEKYSRLTLVKFVQGGLEQVKEVEEESPYGTSGSLKELQDGEMYMLGTDAPGFSKAGWWDNSGLALPVSAKGFFIDEPGQTVTWYPYIDSADDVEAFYWVPSTPTSNETSDIQVDVYAGGQTTENHVDFTDSNGKWVSLGRYNFSGAGTEYVKVTTVQKGPYSRITCIMFVKGGLQEDENQVQNVLFGTDKDILRRLGMLIGEGNGITDIYMAQIPTRIQAAVMYLRLIGEEGNVSQYSGKENFDDVNSEPWAEPYLAYLKAHPELGMVGVGENLFAPSDKIGAKEYGKILLSALGYTYDKDYTWDNLISFAQSIGIPLSEEGDFTVEKLADYTLAALDVKMNTSKLTLLGSIVEKTEGIVDDAHLNGTTLTPELEKLQYQARHKERPLIYNNDGNDTYVPYDNYPYDFDVSTVTEPMTHENFLSKRTYGLEDTQVTTVFYGTGVFDSYTHRSSGETSIRRRDWTPTLANTESDCIETMIDWCRKNDRELFWSMRMNDVHDYAYEPEQLDKWKREHLELLMSPKDEINNLPFGGGTWSAVNYGYREVRQKVYDIIADVASRYDVDGLELDFTRFITYYKEVMQGEKIYPEHIEMMNNLVRSIRQMLDTLSVERGKPILLAIYVPDSLGFNYELGLDVKQWLEEDLIDMVSLGCHSVQFQSWDANIAEYSDYDVPLYAAMDWYAFFEGYDFYKESAYAWEAGMDGIYLYNMFEPERDEFRKLGSPETCGPVDPTYATKRKNNGANAYVKGGDKYIKNMHTSAYEG